MALWRILLIAFLVLAGLVYIGVAIPGLIVALVAFATAGALVTRDVN